MLFYKNVRTTNKFKDKRFVIWLDNCGYFYLKDNNNNPSPESKLTICLYKEYLDQKNKKK
jgi:hypothetical protein